MSHPNFRRSQTDYFSTHSSPTRQDSIISNNSSAYSHQSSAYLPSRTGTISSATSSTRSYSNTVGHKRGISEATGMGSGGGHVDRPIVEHHPDQLFKSARQSLRPLPQAPAASPPNTKRHSQHLVRTQTIDRYPQYQSEDYQGTYDGTKNATSIRPHLHHAYTDSHTSSMVPPDLQELEKSSTSQLRALSKLARNTTSEEFSIATPAPSVVGLRGRRQLKRTDSTAGKRGSVALANGRGLDFGDRNWMDKQRQFLQAYEYLCHIGEAKEWIEDIIHKTIPPIVQLEEALRDGVTLAEIVQEFHPEQKLKIFYHERLQFRHSDNIDLFFRFLEEIGLPDLFRFELIDLYEKKNIPKVIYCIHALSWLLFRLGMVDFRIGNLVGQLQFEHHELEQTQKGLDKAGVSMPSFKGMGESFGAQPEPEPEPAESEEQRQDRELAENESSILDLQSQIRGAVIRIRLGDTMTGLWATENRLIEIQSRIRGEWARQIIEYRLNMRRFSTNLQSAARGFLVRSDRQSMEQLWKARDKDVLRLQNLIRARHARIETQALRARALEKESSVRQLQAAIRGALTRMVACDQYEATREAESIVQNLQAAIRGVVLRRQVQSEKKNLSYNTPQITHIQTAARAFTARSGMNLAFQALQNLDPQWTVLQSVSRGRQIRQRLSAQQTKLKAHVVTICQLQASLRAANARESYHTLKLALLKHSSATSLLQSIIRGFTTRRRLTLERQDLLRQGGQITRLQALFRGGMLRESIGEDHTQLQCVESELIQLQALTRAMTLRRDIGETLAELEEHEDVVAELQALARAGLIRSKFIEKQKFFRENMEKVIKIQSVMRAKIQGQAYKSLTSGKNPPVGTLKGFVHLLNDSDFDFDEEIEFERQRKAVVQHVRQNELADQYITQLDIKIALLVKNKITLDEVIKHQRHFGGHVGTLLPNVEIASKDPFDLKALNKTSRRKLEHYQELFFILQTQPQYLARLFRRIREHATAEKECERIKHLVMGLFGYAQKRREEYYLVKLIARSVKDEVDAAPSLQDYLRTNTFFNKLFAGYVKSPRDRKFMRDVMGTVVKENFVDRAVDLESDPLQIYNSAINNEELRTGQRSRRNPGVPREEAIRDPETRETFILHMQDLRDIADQFFLYLEENLCRMPFGVRFVAQQMYEYLVGRFRHEDPALILQLVGQWLWRQYLQPALVEPEKFGVADRAMTQEQKRNLGEVAKVLSQAASGREFGGDNVYLQPLNTYIRESACRFVDIWNEVVAIPPAEEHYDIDEFNDLYAKIKPTLYIKMADIFSIHQLIASEISSICPSQDDVLRDALRELGSVKSNENELMGVSSSEISLTLNPKLLNATDPDAEVKALFTETKRCVLYIIRIQAGTNLLDILVKPITTEDEDRWDALVRDELQSGNSRRGAYAEASTLLDISTISYPELKKVALENVLQLESIGRITRANHYQDLLNAIAIDIRTKHRRRIQRHRELEGVRTTLARLNEQAVYLEQQLKTYNDYIEQAMVTLQNKKGKKRFLLPFTKQWDHERELQRSGRSFKFGSFKYSARNLADKGVLVHWKGYNERQWDRVDLTISSNEVGVFTIDGSSGNMMVSGANAQVPLDDLLQAQFNNTQFMEFFTDGVLRVNVNLFLHLIMKKFYNE